MSNNRESVLIALADEQNSKHPSAAVVQACRMYLRLVPEPEIYQRHIDWHPED